MSFQLSQFQRHKKNRYNKMRCNRHISETKTRPTLRWCQNSEGYSQIKSNRMGEVKRKEFLNFAVLFTETSSTISCSYRYRVMQVKCKGKEAVLLKAKQICVVKLNIVRERKDRKQKIFIFKFYMQNPIKLSYYPQN